MLKCNFKKIANKTTSSPPANLLHIFRTSVLKNTSAGLLLSFISDRLSCSWGS